MAKELILYSAPGCQGCKQVKEFFESKGVPYTERDISKDESAKKKLVEMGFQATPVVMAGEKTVTGFDPAKLEELVQHAV